MSPAVYSLQMILYDTPGVIEKKMHKLDSMMMKNVRSAAVNADCVVVVVDACKMPEKVCSLALMVSLRLRILLTDIVAYISVGWSA